MEPKQIPLLKCGIVVLWIIFIALMPACCSESKRRHASAVERQEHILRTLPHYEIDYPIEVNNRGRYIRHVTTPTHHRRMRRNIHQADGPVYYNFKFGGKTYNMKLKVNDKLLGSNFVVERHRKNGIVEKTRNIDNCYLVGETRDSGYSAAISDCDGLSGVIDTGDDVIFIEPIINETYFNDHVMNKTGKPHLVYWKSSLEKGEDAVVDMTGDYWKPGFSRAKPGQGIKVEYQAAKSFIKIINNAGRPVKVWYIGGVKELLFSVFSSNEIQNVNTFTSHRWIARDFVSNKRLLIGGKKVYSPPGNVLARRKSVYITIPKGLKLPKYIKPDPPNSHIKIINRSRRFVKLYYVTSDGQKKLFGTLQPDDIENINTYTTHRWYANDYDTGKTLWLNRRTKFLPIRSDRSFRAPVIITVPIGLHLPHYSAYPPLLKKSPKYIEVMTAADASVVRHHGKKNVERYVLTLMNIVSRIFQHKSIGVVIHFVIVKLILLEQDPKGLKITQSPMESLNKVCYWGHKQRKGWDKSSKEFYDQTVFLTRKDFGPSGYAPVSSMCYRTRSCTLNEDDGFPSSFIVAHETGHTLGMEHDGYNNNCSKDIIKGSIMAPLVRSRFDRFYWSQCSRNELIINLSQLWCLDDVPFKSNRSMTKQLPGQIFDRNEQCVMDFGPGYKSCYVYAHNPCRQLWCDDSSYGSYCRTRRTPPLEGTSCGQRMWCRMGYCVAIRKDGSFQIPTPKPTLKPVDGNWTKWSKYGKCSVSCGNGIRLRGRTCTNPVPQHGGRECTGSKIGIAFCNDKACPGIPPTFGQIRGDQCKKQVSKGGKKGEWVFHDVYKVSLDCDFEDDLCSWTNDKSDEFDWTANVGKTPTSKTGPSFDHTKGPYGKGVYMYMESSRPTDVGWRARLVSRLIAKHACCLSFWYHLYGDDQHFGSLQLLVNTTNTEKVVWSNSKDRGDKWRQKFMTILSVMPYRIIFQGIRGDGYRGDLAIDDITFTRGACKLPMKPTVEENKIPVALCYTYCESKKTRQVIRIPGKDGTRCHENPAIFDVCVNGKCQAVGCDGKIGSIKVYDNCGICDGNNATCTINRGTVTTLPEEEEQIILECPVGATNIIIEEFSESQNYLIVQTRGAVNETFINGGTNISTPGVYEIAGTQFIYSRTDGSEKLLALGPLKEEVVFKVKKNKKNKAVSTFVKFKFYKPKKVPETYRWKAIEWSACSKPCGGGIQKRIYDCYRKKDKKKMKHKLCYGVSRPKPWKQSCNKDVCEVHLFWKITTWSSCSVTCSQGVQTRRVKCVRSTYGELNMTVADSECDDTKPPTSKNCSRKECVAMWKAGPWGVCSKTCGRGLRTRTVECRDRANRVSILCTEQSRLQTTSYCKRSKCVDDAPVVLGNLSCSFEAGFCRWRNTRRDDNFDWSLRSGETPSRYTGPSNDHTFRSRRGKYVYAEASTPRRRKDRAVLYSPVIEISKICLDFWFHMLGKKMGTLNVYLKTRKGNIKLWFKEGNQGGRWQNKKLQIISSISYRIVFEAVRGNDYSSDLCLDDITVYTGKCPKTRYVSRKCIEDKTRYCSLAVRFSWCSSIAWGRNLCCKTCSKSIRYTQRRKT